MPRIRSFSLKLVVLFFGAVSAYANRPNTTDVLNRTLAWTHSQNKTVKVTANPQARVWFNDTEIENINYTHKTGQSLYGMQSWQHFSPGSRLTQPNYL